VAGPRHGRVHAPRPAVRRPGCRQRPPDHLNGGTRPTRLRTRNENFGKSSIDARLSDRSPIGQRSTLRPTRVKTAFLSPYQTSRPSSGPAAPTAADSRRPFPGGAVFETMSAALNELPNCRRFSAPAAFPAAFPGEVSQKVYRGGAMSSTV